ncbi:MAG: ABC transporter permease [Defluviitaleaceae bacterium]|nr:ABC transporter permease [Defluviitaleaceae bacterium]
MHYVRVFLQIVKYLFKARLEYPGAWVGGIIAQWFSYGIFMVMVMLTVWNFGTLAGWTPEEVLFLFAMYLLAYALGASFTFNLTREFRNMAINGTMDEAFCRPMPPFLYLVATTFNIGYVSHITLSGAAMIFSITRLEISWGAGQWLWLFVTLLSGGMITACLMLLCEFPALRLRSHSPLAMFFWQGREFLQYPLTIYPRPLQFIFTAILPFSFVGFYPVQVLLGKQDGIFPHVTMWLAPAVALILAGATALVWRFVSRGYESAGT